MQLTNIIIQHSRGRKSFGTKEYFTGLLHLYLPFISLLEQSVFGKMANFSDQTSEEMFDGYLFCSSSVSGSDNHRFIAIHCISMASLCIVLSITATLGNCLILCALRKETSLNPASKLLLRSLAITDLCVGVIGQPLTIAVIFSALFEHLHHSRLIQIWSQCINGILCVVSVLTLTTISVDRLLALLLRLRYKQVVTLQRVRVAVFLFWIPTSVAGVLSVWIIPLFYLYIFWLFTFLPALIISTYSYTRIFLTIRRLKIQLQDTQGNTGLNMARYKKTVFNAFWVHLTLVACYLPTTVVSCFTIAQGASVTLLLAQVWGFTLVYLNSSLNPLLYCWRIKEVRQAAKEIITGLCACFSS